MFSKTNIAITVSGLTVCFLGTVLLRHHRRKGSRKVISRTHSFKRVQRDMPENLTLFEELVESTSPSLPVIDNRSFVLEVEDSSGLCVTYTLDELRTLFIKNTYEDSGDLWTGVAITDIVLDGKLQLTSYIRFLGADGNEVALQISEVMDGSLAVLIAYDLNNRELLIDDGSPLNVLIRGKERSCNVKWLTRIEV